MLIKLDQANGDTVMVNPLLVTRVSKNHTHDDQCLITFDKDNWISVVGSVHAVGDRLSTAMRG